MGAALPDVPFLLLTNAPLSREQWAQLAQRMSWQTLRMNLNTLARHDVFENATLAASVAQRLADRAQVRQSGFILISCCRRGAICNAACRRLFVRL